MCLDSSARVVVAQIDPDPKLLSKDLIKEEYVILDAATDQTQALSMQHFE